MKKKIDVSLFNWERIDYIKKENKMKWRNDVVTELLDLYDNILIRKLCEQ